MQKSNFIKRSLFSILLLIIQFNIQAQTGLNFQGVARTTNNVILASQAITIKLSILQGSTTGTADYTETRKVTTNAQGLFTAVIGDTGAISTLGNFTTINWKLSPKFLKIEMDPAAGTNFITIGTTQFQYVAYAQFSKSADNASTATKLATARSINGISFDGSGDITLSADAGTLSGNTLKSTVTGSSLTSVGTLTNLTVTNPIVGSITGNAATATSATTTTGNAGTATKLATARNINDVPFDGTANITLSADAGTLSGNTLKSTVTGSSLTSVGTISNGIWNGTAISVNKGGTGNVSYTNGQILIGNTTGNTLDKATLTAGVGISIINGNGSITISSRIPNGTSSGEMLYWNGTDWVKVAPGSNGDVLTFLNGIPIWNSGSIIPTVVGLSNKIWMDRNLGATRVATSNTDGYSYGDLFQWGRDSDGHQIRSSATTNVLSTADQPTHGSFIINNLTTIDWRSPQNTSLWQGVNASTNPCPSGFRLPTSTEFNNERLSWISNNAAGAFASPLKLPLAGYRHYSDGRLDYVGSVGHYWTSTISGTKSVFLYISGANNILSDFRALGYSIRCIKD
jgi:hypothetical protein